MITAQTTATLLAAIKQVRSAYMQQGIRITHLMLDGQFELLRGAVAALGITLNMLCHATGMSQRQNITYEPSNNGHGAPYTTLYHFEDASPPHHRIGVRQHLLAQYVPSH
jgi:hypothetical protein